MKRPVFDNVRWNEMLGSVTATILAVGQLLPASISDMDRYKLLGFLAAVLVYLYLRNPKNLDWVNPAIESAQRIKSGWRQVQPPSEES